MYPLTRRESAVKVAIERLDKAVREAGVPIALEVLIKLDVQGHEDRVIRGARRPSL